MPAWPKLDHWEKAVFKNLHVLCQLSAASRLWLCSLLWDDISACSWSALLTRAGTGWRGRCKPRAGGCCSVQGSGFASDEMPPLLPSTAAAVPIYGFFNVLRRQSKGFLRVWAISEQFRLTWLTVLGSWLVKTAVHPMTTARFDRDNGHQEATPSKTSVSNQLPWFMMVYRLFFFLFA